LDRKIRPLDVGIQEYLLPIAVPIIFRPYEAVFRAELVDLNRLEVIWFRYRWPYFRLEGSKTPHGKATHRASCVK